MIAQATMQPRAKATPITTQQVRRAAIGLLNCHDATVTRYVSRETCRDVDPETGRPVDINGGTWYALSVVHYPGEPYEVLCRRKTLVELLRFVEQRAGAEPPAGNVTPAIGHRAKIAVQPTLQNATQISKTHQGG